MDNEREMDLQEKAMQAEATGEVTAGELGAQMAPPQAAQEAEEEQEARVAAIREGIGELFEDGWTAQELSALSEDPAAREAIAKGHSVARAACAMLRARMSQRRHGVPTARAIATGAIAADNPIEHMTDEQFDAFSRRAQEAMKAGQKVRI